MFQRNLLEIYLHALNGDRLYALEELENLWDFVASKNYPPDVEADCAKSMRRLKAVILKMMNPNSPTIWGKRSYVFGSSPLKKP